MTTFEEILSDISNKVTGDNEDSVKASLKQLGSLHKDTTDKLTAFGEENKDKRGNIQSLTKQVRSIEDERDNLKQEFDELKTSNDDVNTELDGLRNFKSEQAQKSRKLYISSLKQVEGNSKFEKASKLLAMPDKTEDGELQWDNLDDAQLESNFNEVGKLNELDYFGEENAPAKKVDGSLGSQTGNSLEDRIGSATTFKELEEIQSDMAQSN